jgi:hypothetical protein
MLRSGQGGAGSGRRNGEGLGRLAAEPNPPPRNPVTKKPITMAEMGRIPETPPGVPTGFGLAVSGGIAAKNAIGQRGSGGVLSNSRYYLVACLPRKVQADGSPVHQTEVLGDSVRQEVLELRPSKPSSAPTLSRGCSCTAGQSLKRFIDFDWLVRAPRVHLERSNLGSRLVLLGTPPMSSRCRAKQNVSPTRVRLRPHEAELATISNPPTSVMISKREHRMAWSRRQSYPIASWQHYRNLISPNT